MAQHFFTQEQKEAIVAAIKDAEQNTSGEVQVHIESHCKKAVMDRAAEVFAMLHMHNTKLRNGVLIYVATVDRKFAIIGDAGINKAVPDGFWDDAKEDMLQHFKYGNLIEGIVEGLAIAGEHLQKYFPHQVNGTNELSDDIAFMDGD